MPVGRGRAEFNHQRIWPPRRPIDRLPDLTPAEFAAADDAGQFHPDMSPETVVDAKCACGRYEFRQPG